MADGITIPSPSVFLRESPTPAPSSPTAQRPTKSARLPSSTTTNWSSSSSTSKPPVLDQQVPKPKQSKSRNGCSTCKAKRLKCDEEKPTCQQCAKRKVECGGYKKDFKWRPFEETNVKSNIDRQVKVSSSQYDQLEVNPSNASTSTSESTLSLTNQPYQPNDIRKDNSHRRDAAPRSQPKVRLPGRPSSKNLHRRGSHDPILTEARPLSKSIRHDRSLSNPPLSGPQHSREAANASILSADQQDPQRGCNNIAELSGLLPATSDIDDECDNDESVLHMLEQNHMHPSDSETILPSLDVLSPLDPDVEEIANLSPLSPSDAQQMWASSFRSTLPLTSLPEIHAIRAWSSPVNYLYAQPQLTTDSPEMMALRFDRLTCGILSVMDGPSENPWRNLIWPMAQQSPALYHAVLALTAFHSSLDIPYLRLMGHEHKQASIRYIQDGIRDRSMSDQTAIATALALGFAESWDQHTASGNTHIKGAQALVKRALIDHQRNPLHGIELARLKFLCNAWVYMDVIARLTSVDSDDSNDFENTLLFSLDAPSIIMGEGSGQSGFGIDFGMPIDARLDPLMGCAGTLFPLVGRVANIVRRVCRSRSNSPAVISHANDLKLALEAWEPPAFIEPPEDPSTQVQHSLQTAEAYRWATLLHLHQSVPELPFLSTAELRQKVLSYLATVPLTSRTVIVHIYPLMAAGSEASTAEDRQWVRDRWSAMDARMRIGVISKCAAVCEEVWRRRDLYEAQPPTQRRLVATAELQPGPQRGEKLKRPHEEMLGASPGRSGVVFTWAEDDPDGVTNAREDPKPWPRRQEPWSTIGKMDSAYTVRGHLHWVGVMWDWGWEVLLG